MGLAETGWLLLCSAALLAVVAVGGYRLGRKLRRPATKSRASDRPEIERAMAVVDELEAVAGRLRSAISNHAPAVRKFGIRLSRFERQKNISWHELCDRAEEMLKPSLRLTAEISHTYAELQQQMSHLSTFAELRTDPLTGAANRQALDEVLTNILAENTQHTAPLSLAMIDIDFFKQINDSRSLLQGDRVLKDLAELLRSSIRQRDVLARYGGEEFVVVMPHTELCGASVLAERIRVAVEARLSITVSIGLAASAHGDTPSTLFSRADAALSLAKSAGRNCVYLHEGTSGRIVGIKTAPGQNPPSPGGKTTQLSSNLTVSLSKPTPNSDSTAAPVAALAICATDAHACNAAAASSCCDATR